jgi:hypothetical protein
LSNSRAGFIACQPPALRRSFSVIGISLTGEQRRAFCAFAKIRAQFTAAAGYFDQEFADLPRAPNLMRETRRI